METAAPRPGPGAARDRSEPLVEWGRPEPLAFSARQAVPWLGSAVPEALLGRRGAGGVAATGGAGGVAGMAGKRFRCRYWSRRRFEADWRCRISWCSGRYLAPEPGVTPRSP